MEISGEGVAAEVALRCVGAAHHLHRTDKVLTGAVDDPEHVKTTVAGCIKQRELGVFDAVFTVM
jgi:hypothetical protein